MIIALLKEVGCAREVGYVYAKRGYAKLYKYDIISMMINSSAGVLNEQHLFTHQSYPTSKEVKYGT